MPALFTFLFKVNIALLLFCLGYYLVLRHLTFYTLNRIYLVAAILFSSIYPWINITDFVQRHQKLATPVQNVIMQWKAPAENLVKPLNQPNYWQWAEAIFWSGVILLAIRLALQLVSLYRLYRHSTPGKVSNHVVRLIDGDVSPFSFWRSIFVNPNTLSPADLEKVLAHEHVHVSEWHTLDILLAELSTIFYWFNPGIWLMKRAVRENIEFITDRKILQKGVDSKQYQYSLLNVSMAGTPNSLVNNFNISTIKKRIIMMNTKRSSRINLSRYMLVAPAVIILLLVFSISKADIAKSTFKSITRAIAHVNLAGDDKLVTIKKAKTNIHILSSKQKSRPADTVYAGKSKDGKKSMLITSDKSLDSVGYVINGAKATRDEVKTLDPGKVMSLDMLSAEDAKQFVDFTIDKSELLFVTTDDSPSGKKLKARIDKAMGHGTLAAARNMASGSNAADIAPAAQGSSYSYSSVNVSSDNAPVAVAGSNDSGSGVSVSSSDNAPAVAVYDDSKAAAKGYTLSKDKIYVTGTPKVAYTIKGKDGKTYTIKKDPYVYLIDKDGNSKKVLYTTKATAGDVVELKATGRPNDVIYMNEAKAASDEITLDNPGMLFIVDGKEAKGMKNIAQADIKSISVLKDGAAEKLYGKKGRNGVIVITTKKGK